MQPNRPFQATPRRGQTTFNVPSHHSSSTAVTPRNGAPSSRSNVTVVLPPSNAAQAHQQQMNNAKQTYETLHRVKELVKDVDNTFTELLDQHETQEYSKIEIAQVLADRDRIREECGLAPASACTTAEANDRGLFDGVVRNSGGNAGLAMGSLTSHQVQQKPHPIVTVDAAQSAAKRGGVGAPPAIVTSDSPAEVVRSTLSTPTTAAGPRAAKPPMDLFQVDEGATRRALRFRRVVPPPTTTSQNTALSQSGLKESDKNTGKGGGKDSRPATSDTVSQYHAQLDRLVRDGDEAQQRTGDLMMYVASVEELLTKLTDMQEQHTATQAAAAGKHPQRSLLAFAAASGGASLSSFTESHFKQIKDVVQRMCDTARSVTDAVGSTVDRLVNMKEQLEARDVAVGPVQSMLKMTKEELLFARQQRDEAKRELMLHRVCARWRRLVRQGREMRGEEFGLICTATQLLGTTSIGQVQQQQQPPLVGTPSGSTNMESDGAAAVSGNGANASCCRNGQCNVSHWCGWQREQPALSGRRFDPCTPPPRCSDGTECLPHCSTSKRCVRRDVERAETELTHCIANVDVMFATTVHVAIGDYDVLWNRFPYAMKAAVRLFNQVVDHVAARFIDGSALVYRSRGSVAFAPHGGYHLLLFRHPHEAIHFSTMLHVALLLAPWPQKILDIRGGPSGDRSNDATDEDFSLGADSSPSVEAGAWGETMKLSDGTNHRKWSSNVPSTTNSGNAQQQQASCCMLRCSLLHGRRRILDIRGGPSGDRSNDATDEDFSLGADSSPSVEAGAWGETMKLSDGTNHRKWSSNVPSTTNSGNAQQQQASTPSQPIRYDATALDTSGVTWNGHTNPPTMLATNASGAAGGGGGGDDKQKPTTARSDQLRFDERVGFVQAKQNATTDGPTPHTICGGAGTIIYDPERCVHTIELQRPRVSRPLSLGGNEVGLLLGVEVVTTNKNQQQHVATSFVSMNALALCRPNRTPPPMAQLHTKWGCCWGWRW
ncbi:Hypothetical protein, putative [Bodo saltans]|uniref:Uncharacterized protein n=1 Tax=Bodo saltans TaxID=75058 RepID=A0A0S4INC2_BODSA|nr:Hypothetical protein, putative [Bodo saltans]|eukprot:CUE70955.1 Hypothetical protein, putative [Bodo saltans]